MIHNIIALIFINRRMQSSKLQKSVKKKTLLYQIQKKILFSKQPTRKAQDAKHPLFMVMGTCLHVQQRGHQ